MGRESEWARVVDGDGFDALGYSQTLQPAGSCQVAPLGDVCPLGAIMVAASATVVFTLILLEHRARHHIVDGSRRDIYFCSGLRSIAPA